MFRNVLRRLISSELGVLGGEIARAKDQLSDMAITLAALEARAAKLINRANMQLTRNAPAEEAELVRALQMQQRNRQGPPDTNWDDGKW